nr:ankyrin repeat domain containing protein [Mimivirus sp.]
MGSFIQAMDTLYPISNKMDKKQCCDKLIELFIVYGCEYDPYLYKLDSNHLKIIKTIEFSKKYFKTIKNELQNICTEFVYKPGSIRSNMIKIQWEYRIGLDYCDIKNPIRNYLIILVLMMKKNLFRLSSWSKQNSNFYKLNNIYYEIDIILSN